MKNIAKEQTESLQMASSPNLPRPAAVSKTVSRDQPLRIGITGSMGSGKSSAGKILSRYIPFTDCDQINSRLLESGAAGWQKLKENGLLILDEQGQLDRAGMAAEMFSNPETRKTIEGILQPLILQEMEAWLARQDGLCAVEVPLLFECQLQDRFDQVWTVICDDQTALKRLEEGRGIAPEQAKARLALQYPPQKKAELSSAILYNDSTLENLEAQILVLLAKNGLDIEAHKSPDPKSRK